MANEKTINIICAFPMNGLSIESVEDRRNALYAKAVKYLKKMFTVGINIGAIDNNEDTGTAFIFNNLDNIHKENIPEDAGRLWYLGDSIQLLDKANLVIFGNDWESAKGCNVEMTACKQYDIPFIIEGEDVL